jgi:hypothetical protein
LEELLHAEILTERHNVERYTRRSQSLSEVGSSAHFCLLKTIMSSMKGDDIFGGCIPKGCTTMMPERLAQLSSQKVRAEAKPGGFLETVLQMVNIVSASQPVPVDLMPEKSLLYAIRQIKGPEWDGVLVELKMENLDHVLLITESFAKK